MVCTRKTNFAVTDSGYFLVSNRSKPQFLVEQAYKHIIRYDVHIERALTAAKNPQLKMKLENMPVALTADMIDEYMGPILVAAKTGDLSIIKNVN